MEPIRALFFDPSARRVSVRTIGLGPLAPGAVRVRVESVLLSRSIRGFDAPASVPGGAFAGTVLEAHAEATHPVGTRVVGIALSNACATETIAPGASVFAIRDSISTDDAVISATPGIHASCAVAKLGELDAREILVLGADGLTGSLVAGLASTRGVVCHGVSNSPTDATDATRCGFSSVSVASDLRGTVDWGRLSTIVDCTRSSSLSELVSPLAAHLPWVVFPAAPGRRSPADLAPDIHVVDAVTMASRDISQAIEHFRAVALPLAAGALHLSRTRIALDDAPGIWLGDHLSQPGALILRPNGS